jgi:hypothetical protein
MNVESLCLHECVRNVSAVSECAVWIGRWALGVGRWALGVV